MFRTSFPTDTLSHLSWGISLNLLSTTLVSLSENFSYSYLQTHCSLFSPPVSGPDRYPWCTSLMLIQKEDTACYARICIECNIHMHMAAMQANFWVLWMALAKAYTVHNLYLADPGEARGCSANTSVIYSLINSVMVCENIFMAPPGPNVWRWGFRSQNRLCYNVSKCQSKGIQIALLVQKLCDFNELVNFAYWWSFSGEGSASAACIAGLFLNISRVIDCMQSAHDPVQRFQ